MNPTSQELPNLNFTATQATFDPNSQSLILSDPSNLVSYNLPTQTVSSKATWSLPSSIDQSLPAEPTGFPLNTSFLRFTPAHSKSKIHISPSGLIATNQGQAEEIAIGNIGFKTGIHYWEIICPKHCKNIHVGVIQEGWSSTNPAADNNLIQANTFKTSTPRVIGLRLDLIRGELRFWLNRNFQVHKTINNLAHTTWYPCVKLKEPGTHVILNPFAIDPDSSYPIYEPQNKLAISQIKSTLSLYVLVGGFEKLQEGPVKLEGPLLYETTEGRFEPVEHNIDESGSIVAFRFKTPADAESFQKANQGRKHNNKNLIIFDNLRLLSCVLEVLKTNKEIKSLFSDKQTQTQYTKMLSWVLRCLPYFCNYHQNPESESPEHQENLNQFQTLLDSLCTEAAEESISQAEETSPINDISIKFIQKSDTLLATHGNLIKLLHRENGKYNVSPGTFTNRPKTPKDEVILTINRDTVKTILTTLDFKTYSQTLSRNKSTLQAFIQVFRALQSAYAEKNSSVLTFKAQYKHAKIFVNGVSGALITSIKWLKALLNSTCDLIEEKNASVKPPSTDPHFETEVLLPFEGLIEPPIRDKPAKPEKKCCHCTSEEPESSAPKVCKICKRVGIDNMIFKNITFNQILQLLQSLLVLDETLYAMSLHEEASDKLKRYWISRKPRLFTAFGRLGSLLNFPGNKYSLVELAEAGLYNTQDLLFELRHFLEPERRVDELQNTQEDIDLWSLLKKALPENRMIQGYPCENVPLSVSLNNIPAQPHSYKEQDNIAHVATNPQTSIVASVSNSGEVKLWNTEFALVSLGHANFREELGGKNDIGGPSVPSKKDPLSEDNVFDGLDVDEFKPSDVSQVPPDQGMVDTLYSMGFPVRLAKKALSLTKNAGIAVAVEKILALQEEEKAEKAESPEKGVQPRVKQIKPQWDCQACTFVNSNNSKICEICGTPAPEEAYFTEEELSTPKETEKVIDSSAKEEEIPDTKKNFLEHAKVHSSIVLPVESSPLSPVVVGVLFEEGKPESEGPRQYQLRFKRFMYSQNYIKKFIKKENNKGYSNLISGTWFSLDSKEPQEHLTRDYGLTFRALDPIFIGNSRYSDPKKEGKHSLFNGDLVQFDHADLIIESAPGTLLACIALPPSLENNKEVSRLALVWRNQDKLSLQQVSVSVRAAENLIDGPPSEHSLAVKEFANNDLGLNGNFLFAEVLQDKFIISTDLAVHVYDANRLDNQLSSVQLPFKPTLAQPLTPQSIAYLGDKNYYVLQLDKDAAAVPAPKQHSSQSRKTQDLPIISDLKDKDLDVLQQILHKRALPANNPTDALTLSSNPLVFAGNSTKFYQPIASSNTPQTLDVSFTHPSSLISIELSLQLNYIPSNPLKTKDSERFLLTDLGKLQQASGESSGSASETPATAQKISNQLPALNLSDVDSEGKFLPLTVSWYQGAAFNDSFPVSRIIAPNNDVFCANYGNSEFLFEHLHGKSMLIKSFTVCSKFKPIGSCGFPIGSGLVFTANYLSHLNIPAKFQNMTHQQYLQWLAVRSQSSDELEPWEPVGSFELDGNSESITVDLQYVRPCKYILLRPTNMRTKPENFAHQFKNSPVEIKFFGVSGTTVSPAESDEVTPKPILDNSEYLRIKDSVIEVQAQNEDGQWIDIQKLENIQVQEIIDRQHTRTFLKLGGQWDILSRIPLSGLSRQEVSGERLAQLKVNQLRVRITQSGENLDRWVIAGVGVQAYAPLNAEAFMDLDFSPAVLRKAMLDSREFERFNKELVLELNKENVSSARKEKIVALISDIISAESTLCPLFYSHFDLKKFLLSSVLSQQNFSFKESQSLLRHFSCLKSFENNLLESTLQILPNLSTAANVTPAGLNGFFTMLTWCQRLDPAKIFNYMLKELHEVSKRISQLRAPEYNILRTYFNIKGLVLEKELFRETSTISKKSSSKKSKDENEKRKQNVPIKAKILSYNSNDVDEYLINLGQNTQVDEIRLAFEQNSKTVKFRVQIWAILPGKEGKPTSSPVEESKEQESQNTSESRPIKKLLQAKAYNESTWVQLSNYAYDRPSNESNFGPTEELECLGYSNLNVTTKYLVVQITYSLLPLMQGNPEKNDKKPLPEVYGRVVESSDSSTNEISEISKLFDTSKVTYKSSVKYPHTVKYEKCEVTNKTIPYKHMLGAVGTITNQVQESKPTSDETTNAAPKVNTKALTEKLDKLQSELCSRLASMKAGPPTPQSKDEIKNLCKEIKICQSKLYNARETQTATDAEPAPTTFLAQPEKSLDYLYTIAQKLSSSLRKIDSATSDENKAWRKDTELRGEKGRTIALEIFEYLIAYELSTTSKEFTSLLSEVLVHNLKPNEWQQFVINVINTFLTNSNALPAAQENLTMSMIPTQKIYSPAKIIQALDKISIPTGELLSFLTGKLEIPIGLPETVDKKKTRPATQKLSAEEESSTLSTLASILLLLNSSFKKVQPSETGDLTPPGMRRSVSSKSKEGKEETAVPTTQRVENIVEIKKFNHEESLQAAFYICIWICENPNFSETDKSHVLALGLDLVLQIMKFAKVSGIRDLLRDPNSFLKLFMSTLKLTSPVLLTKFQGLLNAFLNPKQFSKKKTPEVQTPDEDALAEETKMLLVHHLQTILKWLLGYALNIDQPSSALPRRDDIAPSVWLEHICFILEFLLLAADKITVDPKKESNKTLTKKKFSERKKSMMTEEQREKYLMEDDATLLRPGMPRSMSMSQESKSKDPGSMINLDELDKSTTIPLDSIMQLIALLSTKTAARSGFNLSHSTKAWSLLMKAILKVKVTTLVEGNIFSSLISSFLASSEDIQQIMFPEIIDFTLNMLKQQTYQKELCNAVLNVTFSTLNNLNQSEQYESIAFSLLRGWLDILISKSSPKPAENYNKLPDKVFCKLNAQGAATLFINLGKYLWNSLNLGSRDGAHNSSEFTLLKLQIAEDLLRLLVSSESTSNLLAIGELFANFKKHSGEIKTAVQYYLEWFLLNRANDSNATPSTDSLKSITEDMLKLFQIIGDYQEVSKVAIAALISGCKKMDQVLLKLQPAHKVSTYTLLQYNSQTCSTLEQLFDLWVTSDAIASYVAFEVKGFEYLLDRMGVAYRTTEKLTSAGISKPTTTTTLGSLASLLEGSDYLEQISSTKEGGKLEGSETTGKDNTTSTSTSTEEDPKEEEIANKLTIINLPGQSWAGITPDWSINKKGVRARIMYFQMNGNFHNEYCLLFSLERVVELKQIRIGFNTVWTDHTDKVLGVPSSVIVEGGTSQNDLSHIATLEPINDEGYSNFSVKVFHKNFQHIGSQSPKSLEECLESLGNKRVSYLKFRFRRPVVTFVEGLSLLSNKIYKNIAVSISFISIAGFDVKKLPNAHKKLMDAQENSALQVISKLCNNQFTETLGTLANEKNVINKIRSSFDNLTNLLMPHESWLAPVFLAIASHNPEMGDWIITKFLDLSKSREHAKLVGDIILIDNEHLFERLARLNNFVLNETKRISSLGSKNESLSKFNSLVPFIEVLCTAARSISRDLIEKSSSSSQTLNFGKEELDAIIHSFEAYSTSTHNKVLIKLLVLYLYTPAPFVLNDSSLLKYALEKLWKAVRDEGKPIYYEMLGPVAIGSNSSAKWFITHVEEIISDLIEKLENLGANELRNLRHAFILLCTISYHEQIKKKISQGGWHLKFYHALKNKEESAGSSGATVRTKPTLKEIDSDMLQLAVEFLKNVSLGYPATEEEIIKALVADLETLEAKKDISFINNLFVPLLNAEANVPVCLHPYDPQSKRTVISGKQLPSSAPAQQVSEPLKSEILNKDQTETLLKTVQHFTSASGLYRKIKDLPWELAMTNKTDGENLVVAVREKMSKQGPFVIIMEGTNAGKKCYVGVFCSQNMAEIPEDIDTGFDKEYPIPMSDDNFIFYYEDDYRLHFPIPSFPNQTDFGQFRTFYDGGGVLSFFYNNTERIFISFISSQTSYVDIDLYDMKPMQQDLNQAFPTDIPAEFVFKSAEYWILKTNTNTPLAQKNKKGKINVLNNVLCPQWYNPHQPFNYFRATPVYNIPVSVNVQKLVEITLNSDINVNSKLTQEVLNPNTTLADLYDFVTNDQSTNGIIDVEFDVLQYSERQLTKKETPQVTEGLETDESLNYKPVMSIFDTFERNGGVERILELALKSLIKWKDKDKSKRWFTWVQELSSFSSLPIFFGLFMKSKACMDLLFQVIVGAPDTDKAADAKNPKKWEEEEQKAVKLAYQILANVFSVNTDAKLREFAIQKNFFTRILDRIGIISKEFRRKWVDDQEAVTEEQEKDNSPELKEKGDSDKKLDEEDYKKKVVKKKGVGYASDNTGQNQRWNVSEYVQSKKARNEQLQGMIEILHNFINVKEWHPSKKILNEICESALLPLLEAAFRSASLLEMAKEAELNQSYLKLTRAIAHHRGFIPCLLELDPHYQPSQKDSIYKLLGQLKELGQIFLNCLTASDKDSSAPNQKLATNIIETYKIVDEALQSDEDLESDDGEGEIMDLLSQPLALAYRNLLQNLRFDYVNMKDAGTSKFKHHYASYITNNTPPQPKMVRLAQELADLSTALPIEHTNSIFVRVDESRVDVMKALVMGAAGTPYAHGAYEFDVFFDDSYPNAPPKVNLTTTGAGKVRFNPNLYSCGKVCLSLLGTWRGNASENWDPKLSTLLQVLVSIQAIIMAEDVYFNEPGFEGEAGTDEGEKKNEAYSNIVRYCNIRYAMIDQMRNPPKGFETVIRRHFYLKKDEILEEVNKWVKYAEHRDASYTGLINDHNPSWCSEFKSSKTKYKDMIKTAITELEAEFAKLPAPSGRDLHQKVLKRKEKKAEKVNINAGVANLEDIDVSYDKEGGQKNKAMNINDEDVKDRWSRYIGAMGIDAVTKQANASIFMSGLGALGVEIAKNIVLSGVNKFTIHDKAKTTFRDLSGQFFLGEEDIGKNRAQASLNKIQQLNYYVNVDTALLDQPLPKEEAEIDKLLKGYTLVILSETDYETLVAINKYCRKNHIHFITTDLYGPFSRVFNDFGDEFVVVDKNGEEVQEVMLGKITNEEQGVVSLLAGHTHKLEDGDEVLINGVDGMTKENEDKSVSSINGTKHKVQVINASSFKIGDTRGYSAYIGNGLAKQVKTPVLLKFQSFEQSITSETIPFDSNMLMHDFLKINHPYILHIAFEAFDQFVKKYERLPKPWDLPDSEGFLKLATEAATKITKDYNAQEDTRFEFIIRCFSFTCQGVFAPLAAFLGGFVAQEAIKAITQKFMPTKQFFYTDCYEVIPDLPENKSEWDVAIECLDFVETRHRSDGLRICVGAKLLQNLQYTNLFMVGSGAIGCELLKNYAMLGLGTGEPGKYGNKEGGKIILTDPDVIEVSNLTRQFLFREKHLRKPKSQTAAAAAIQMNKELKGHIIARLDKVHDGTANIFTDKFFEDLTVVTNALDNVQARRYVDMRCVNAKTPLLESGTLGPKGHVQVIIPYKTESYGSQEDPKEDAEIPHCTLKMFPEETLHCVEWARDKFGKLFTQRPKGLNKVVEDPNFQVTGSTELKTLTEAVTLLKKRPLTFDDCIRYARIKFQKYLVNDIRQLLYTYPLDAKTKEGRPFWSLPKRPPTETTFDPKDPLHINFIAACACLRAKIFDIPIPKDARKDSEKAKMAEEAAKVKVPDFKPSQEKAQEINAEVDKEASKQATGEEGEDEETPVNEAEELLKDLKAFAATLPKDKEGKVKCCSPEEFEKDNDQNFHIDFISSIANCRASNYKLEPMDWLTVKIKAGRIIPALATTTASVAGLQTIELCKLLKNCKVEDMKNAFLSLAVPIMALSEPAGAPVTKLTDKLSVNLWDRWDVTFPRDATLKDLFDYIEKTHDLIPKDVTYGSQAIYFHALMDIPGKEKEKEKRMKSKLEELLNLEKDDKYADLNVMCSKKEDNQILKGVPPVRVILGSTESPTKKE